jgi:hypothetical protein
MTWELDDKCPHCGHRAALHSAPLEYGQPPPADDYRCGRCHAETDCTCPGWHPIDPAESRARWDRIHALRAELDVISSRVSRGERRRKKGDPPPVVFYETPEWETAATEYRDLIDVERDAAIESGWPVWQEHQACTYVEQDGQTLRCGHVLRFDRAAGTVTLSGTWTIDNKWTGYLYETSGPVTVTVQQIIDGERLDDEREEAERAAHARERRRKEAPLLADDDEQPRLPGKVGKVRDVEIQHPQFTLPPPDPDAFTLTAPSTPAVQQRSLFED